MFRLKMLVIVVLVAVSNIANAVNCDIGIYSKYVNDIDVVLTSHVHNEPVVQAECTKSFTNGAYVNVWGSQSLRDPGLSRTFGNELDLTVGWAGKLSGKWSADVHAAYYDIANPRVLDFKSNGDLANAGGMLQYAATTSTSIYGLVEGYHGIGSLGFPGGWKAGAGAKTTAGPVVINATLFHNQNFLGHGQFLKFAFETVEPIAKFAGGKLRPVLVLRKPLGSYADAHDFHAVVGLRFDF